MARTALTEVAVTMNAKTATTAGDAVNPGTGNGHKVAFGKSRRLLIRIDATFSGAKNYTFKAGVSPAQRGGQGDLVLALNAEKCYIVLESGRFVQADGMLYIDVETSASGTIEAVRLPAGA